MVYFLSGQPLLSFRNSDKDPFFATDGDDFVSRAISTDSGESVLFMVAKPVGKLSMRATDSNPEPAIKVLWIQVSFVLQGQ